MVDYAEKRSGTDRRQVDVEFTAQKERRRNIESRKLSPVELSISEEEWATYFGPLPQKADA